MVVVRRAAIAIVMRFYRSTGTMWILAARIYGLSTKFDKIALPCDTATGEPYEHANHY